MKAELINIGDELLIGHTINSNAAWIGTELNKAGISVSRTIVVGDTKEDIVSSLDGSLSRVKLVIITGGLGPTNDDITKSVLAEYFGSKLSINEEILEHVSSYFKKKKRPMLEVNNLQALLHDDAEILKNNMGTASGMWFDIDGKVVISIPGVPYEVKHLISERIIPKLKDRFTTESVHHKIVLTTGLGESFLADKIKLWEDSLEEDNIKLAYLPSSDGKLKLRLSSSGQDISTLKNKTDAKIHSLQKLIPELIYGYDDDEMEKIIGDLLKRNGKKLGTAESCTGGYISHMITSVAGSSAYYEGSAITYSYASKSDLLKVSNSVIVDKGAVSEEVVKSMALGLFDLFDIDYAIAVSGIAGPGGETEDKDVGTVWMAVGTKENLECKKYKFGNHRIYNIKITAMTALNVLRKQLLEL